MSDVTLYCLVRAIAVVEWQLQGKPEVFEENPSYPSATSSITNPTPTDLVLSLRLHEKPATNLLSHGTAR
jgi:hypothetical protein